MGTYIPNKKYYLRGSPGLLCMIEVRTINIFNHNYRRCKSSLFKTMHLSGNLDFGQYFIYSNFATLLKRDRPIFYDAD